MTIARFCSACGAALSSPPPVRCSRCGTDHWRGSKACANALVVREARILLVLRAHAPWQGMWCAPGGFCDAGEHPVETAEREILEETGFRARVTGWIGIWVSTYADDPEDGDADTISVAYYLAVPADEGGAAFDAAETAEVAWFALDELPQRLAPLGVLEEIVAAASPAIRSGELATPLPDRPFR